MNDKIVLNEEQNKAVEHENGPLLIIAGAGTGKTTVLTERIKWIVNKQKAHVSEIVALTFTEKAAREMEERVDVAMPYGYIQMWISTFHSFCDRILRDDGINIGLDPGFCLMTEADCARLLRDNLFKLELDYFRPLGNPTKFITSLLQHFSRLKDEDVLPSEYIHWAQSQKSKVKSRNEEVEIIDNEKYLELAKVYRAYEELKVKEGRMDFADLISNTSKLFRLRKNILSQYQKKFKYILVDEFQDTNIAQYELIKLLSPNVNNPNLTIVADDNQSIYRFRGAAVSNILFFNKDYPSAKTVVLNKNYRSTQVILDSAYKLIKYNDPDTLEATLGISKKLISQRKRSGTDIVFLYENRVEDEAERVVQTIKKVAVDENYLWSDFAILVRANNHAETFTRALSRMSVPYQFLGPGMLFRQEEVKELIAYLNTLNDLTDSASFYKVLSMDIFGLSGRDLTGILIYAKKYNLSLFEAIEKLVAFWSDSKELGAYARHIPSISEDAKLQFKKIIRMTLRHLDLVSKETAGQILYYFLEDSAILKELITITNEKNEKRAQNISKFFDKLKTFEGQHDNASVSAVVDWINLFLELGESPLSADTDWTQNDAVNILTIHSSKGLEFNAVFLVNLVSARFPTVERREKIPIPQALIKEILPKGDYHLEEERRLCYVGATRARDYLFLTAANYYGEGKRTKKISPFVIEMLGEKIIGRLSNTAKNDGQLSLFSWKKTEPVSKPAVKLPVSYLSYSQIQTFEICPLHYKLRYSLRIPTLPSAALSFGTTIHAAFRDFYQLLVVGNQANMDTLLSIYRKNWIADGFTSKKHELMFLEKGEKYIRDYYKLHFSAKSLPATLEIPFRFPIRTNLSFGGKIDRVDRLPDGRIEIIDYKTGEKIPSQVQVDRDLQLTLYALAATEVKDRLFSKKPEEVVLSLFYFDGQKKISTTRSKDQLIEAKNMVIKVADKIEASDFKCRGGEFCRNCEFKLYCDTI